MRITIFMFIIFQSCFDANGQVRVTFHEYEPTASSWDIIHWNIKDTTNVKWVVKETIDIHKRVVQLEFLENGAWIQNHLCYLANRVTFEYKDNLIIETLYSGELPLVATDCEMPYKKIYHLDKENYIQKIEVFAKYDFTGMDSTEIHQWKKWVPEYSLITTERDQLQVDYYYYSSAKLSGLYPVLKAYVLTDDYYYGDEPEKSSIIDGLSKLRKQALK